MAAVNFNQMIIKSIETREVTAEQLAEALAKSTPKEFADVWFKFNEICEKEKIDLEAFAEAMYPDLGANRKKPLRTIFQYMEYLEVKNRRS